MGKTELGQKCTCVSCAARFFDLGRSPAICPKCGTEQPKLKQRPFAPSRPATRNWSSQPPPDRAAAPLETQADEAMAADEAVAAEDADDADLVEPDGVEDDIDVPVLPHRGD